MNVLVGIGRPVAWFVAELGGIALLGASTLRLILLPPYKPGLILREIDNIGARSMAVVGTVTFLIGMVLVVNAAYTMQRYGADIYVGPMVALVMFRELGPVLTGVIVAALVGSGISGEIGAMQISEQIDAMRALGANPVKTLVVPKVIAAAVALPLLTAMADVLGVLGGMLMAVTTLQLSANFYITSITDVVRLSDFTSGVSKTIFFGLIVALVSCHEGFRTTGGSVGVRRSIIVTVVLCFLFIVFADLVLTSLFISFGGFLTM